MTRETDAIKLPQAPENVISGSGTKVYQVLEGNAKNLEQL